MSEISTNGPLSGSVASRLTKPVLAARGSAAQGQQQVTDDRTQARPITRVSPAGFDSDPISKAEEVLNQLLDSKLGTSRLRINQDNDSGRFIYESVDRESGEVLKQFPPEQVLQVLAFSRQAEGIVLDDQV